jgi:hypothetical protein
MEMAHDSAGTTPGPWTIDDNVPDQSIKEIGGDGRHCRLAVLLLPPLDLNVDADRQR